MTKLILISIAIILLIAGIFYFTKISSTSTGNVVAQGSIIKLQVQIPCAGHATLIKNSLLSLNGITNVQFTNPNIFLVSYDPNKLNKGDILSIQIFKEYPAKEI